MAIHFNKNSDGLQRALKSQQSAEESKNWQENIKNPTSTSQTRKKTNIRPKQPTAIHKTTAKSLISIDNRQENPFNGDISSSSAQIRYHKSRAEDYNMQQDIQEFIRPPLVNNTFLSKDKLAESSIEILTLLEQSDAHEGLKKRAVLLLEEEQKVKSIIDGYQNSLIFS